jgi:hypothetical protein
VELLIHRTEFLRLLEQMKIDDTSRLKESGIGQTPTDTVYLWLLNEGLIDSVCVFFAS